MDGLGTFGLQQTVITLANGAFSVFAAEVDGDGDLDVLPASILDDRIAWYEDRSGQVAVSTDSLEAGYRFLGE